MINNFPIAFFKAYWLLDNEDFEEAIAMLLDPLVDTNDISETEHRTVILALLTQNQPKLALKYCNVRKPPKTKDEDLQLHTAIYLANGMVQEAFQLLRGSKIGASNQRLFAYFLSMTENMGKMGIVLQMTLSMQEEKFLVDFLQESQLESSKEILLEYYLQRARYSEATQLNQHLSQQQHHRFSSGNKTRQAIIDRYSKLIPSMNFADQFAKHSWIKPQMHMEPSIQRVQVMPFDTQITPNFKANTLAKRNELLMQSFMPSVNQPITPFRSKNQRQDQFRGKKFLEIPVLMDDNEENKTETQETNTNLLSILSTPIIRRKTAAPGLLAQDKETLASSSTENTNRCHTPQSILKIKRLIQIDEESNSPQLSSQRIEKEEIPKRNDSRMSRESTPGKSLRFNVPKKLPPTTIEFEEDEEQPQKQQDQEVTNEDHSESSSDLEIIDDDDVKTADNVVESEDEETNQEIEDIDIESVASESKEEGENDSAMLHLTDDEGDVEEPSVAHESDNDDGKDEASDDTNSTTEIKVDIPDDQTVAMTPTTMQKFVSELITPKHPLIIDHSEGDQTTSTENFEMTFNFGTPVDKTPHMSESEQKRFVASLVAQATPPTQYSFANPDIASPMTSKKNLGQVPEQSEDEENNEAKMVEEIEKDVGEVVDTKEENKASEDELQEDLAEKDVIADCDEEEAEAKAQSEDEDTMQSSQPKKVEDEESESSGDEAEDEPLHSELGSKDTETEEETESPKTDVLSEKQEDLAEKDITEETRANRAKGPEKGEEVDITAKDKENPETEAIKETSEKEVDIDENEAQDQTGKEDKDFEGAVDTVECVEDPTEKVDSASSSSELILEVSADCDEEEAEAKTHSEDGDTMQSSQPKKVEDEELASSGDEAEDEPLQSTSSLDQTVPLTPSTMKRFLADLVSQEKEIVEEKELPKTGEIQEDLAEKDVTEETRANEAKGLEKGEEVDITAKDKENPETEASKETPENERKDQELKEVDIDENETGKEDKEETVSSRRKRHSSKTSSNTQNTPLRRSHRRVSSQSTKQEEKLEIVSEPALVPSKRQRHSSRDSTDSSAPLRRSRRISQSSHEGDQLIGTTEAVSAKPRRSRRVSQTSNDSDNPETPLKSSKRLAQKRTSTPRSTSKPKLEKKPLPMEPLTEEIEESNLDSIVQPAPRRKRQLSEASKLTAIIGNYTIIDKLYLPKNLKKIVKMCLHLKKKDTLCSRTLFILTRFFFHGKFQKLQQY